MRRFFRRRLSLAIAIPVLAVGAPLYFWLPAARLAIVYDHARVVADDPHRFAARLTTGNSIANRALARVMGLSDDPPALVAAKLLECAQATSGDLAARAKGTAHFIIGEYKASAAAFAAITRPSASDWNDRAAAQLSAALAGSEEEFFAEALVASDRARAVAPDLRETLFNRAAILDAMGMHGVAAVLWRRYIVAAPESRWCSVADSRLGRNILSEREVWLSAVKSPFGLSSVELARLTDRSPEQARRFGEGLFLSAWAEAVTHGDGAVASRSLDHARLIAAMLQRKTGETLLADAVGAIDRASENARRSLVAAHVAYRSGRVAFDQQRFGDAELDLRRARDAFVAGGSPMAAVADSYLAYAIYEQNGPVEALENVNRLLGTLVRHSQRYRGLFAQVQYQLSLFEAVQGHWSASLTAAAESARVHTALGERAYAAAAMATLAEDYDFLGRQELAWRYGVAALRMASASGDLLRARTVLAVLCRTEMRGRRWDRARAITSAEVDLSRLAVETAYDADLYRRRAVAEWHLQAEADSSKSLLRARAAATSVKSEVLRSKLIADIDGAEGMILRRRDPRAAVALLTSAIDFRRSTERPILLPELYLERGRAHLTMSAFVDAERDFTAGIEELERQRGRVDDPELRSGIFADSSELFDEVVALQLHLDRGIDSVLAFVERGRARAMLEQIDGIPPQRQSAITVSQIQRTLGAGSIFVEYVSLPNFLAVIVVSPNGASMRTVSIGRRQLEHAVRRFADALASGGEAADDVLYDSLVQPIGRDLEYARAINIVADHVLERLPFAALRWRASGERMIERYVLATSPSARIFAATERQSITASVRLPSTAVVFGNPVVDRDQLPNAVNLPAAEREAWRVAELYPHHRVFVRHAATVEAFLATAPCCDVVHFAGHAIVRPREPALSALLLAPSGSSSSGTLPLREIARMRFRLTRVIVLAACSTLEGRKQAVEGVPSIARAFLIAGVPAVVGTLWDIEDSDAAPLMRAFHERLARGLAPAEALRQTQIDAIRGGHSASNWAAFMLTGVGDAAATSSTATSDPSASPVPKR